MKNIALFIIFFTVNIINVGVEAMEVHGNITVNVISPDFYIGKIPNKPHLSAVLERITTDNYKDWKNYARHQNNKHALSLYNFPSRKDGTGHFKFVLDSVDYNLNELWVGYITREKDPKPNPIRDYTFIESINGNIEAINRNTPDRNIEMFITVTSNPKARITFHLGISITLENMIRQGGMKDNSAKSISMDLHAFLATVMLMRNPERRYMISSPTAKMESIIASHVPHIFVGTKEDYDQKNSPKLSFEEFKKLMNVTLESEDLILRHYQNYVDRFTTNQKKEAEFLANDYNKKRQRILNENGGSLDNLISQGDRDGLEYDSNKGFYVTQEKLKAKRETVIKEQWDKYMKPIELFRALKYELEERAKLKGKKFNNEDYELFLKAHPPLISRTYTPNRFIIYEKNELQKPWLEIDDKNEDYNWIFQAPFVPAGNTHYVAVDLKELATCLDDNRKKSLDEEKEVIGFSKG